MPTCRMRLDGEQVLYAVASGFAMFDKPQRVQRVSPMPLPVIRKRQSPTCKNSMACVQPLSRTFADNTRWALEALNPRVRGTLTLMKAYSV